MIYSAGLRDKDGRFMAQSYNILARGYGYSRNQQRRRTASNWKVGRTIALDQRMRLCRSCNLFWGRSAFDLEQEQETVRDLQNIVCGKRAENQPKVYKEIHVEYILQGNVLNDNDVAHQAIRLSKEKCYSGEAMPG